MLSCLFYRSTLLLLSTNASREECARSTYQNYFVSHLTTPSDASRYKFWSARAKGLSRTKSRHKGEVSSQPSTPRIGGSGVNVIATRFQRLTRPGDCISIHFRLIRAGKRWSASATSEVARTPAMTPSGSAVSTSRSRPSTMMAVTAIPVHCATFFGTVCLRDQAPLRSLTRHGRNRSTGLRKG
jgi:hypothetical protein